MDFIWELYIYINKINRPTNIKLEDFVINDFNSYPGKYRFYEFSKSAPNIPILTLYILFRQSIYLADVGFVTGIGVHESTIDHFNFFYGKFEFLKFIDAVDTDTLLEYRQWEINTMREFYRPPQELQFRTALIERNRNIRIERELWEIQHLGNVQPVEYPAVRLVW